MGQVVTITTQYELKPFEFQCEGCKVVHKRSLWSIAHSEVTHSFKCDCGQIKWFKRSKEAEDD